MGWIETFDLFVYRDWGPQFSLSCFSRLPCLPNWLEGVVIFISGLVNFMALAIAGDKIITRIVTSASADLGIDVTFLCIATFRCCLDWRGDIGRKGVI